MKSDLLKGWRTIVANAMAGLPVLVSATADFASVFLPAAKDYSLMSYLPKEWLLGYILFVIVLNMALRKITTTPMGKKL